MKNVEKETVTIIENGENAVVNAETLAAKAAAMGWQVKESVVETITVAETKTGLKVKAGGYFVDKSAELANAKLAAIVLAARNAYAKAVAVADAEAERQASNHRDIISEIARLVAEKGEDAAKAFANVIYGISDNAAAKATADAAVARVTEKVTRLDEPITIVVASKKHLAGDFIVDKDFNVIDDVYQENWTETRIVG